MTKMTPPPSPLASTPTPQTATAIAAAARAMAPAIGAADSARKNAALRAFARALTEDADAIAAANAEDLAAAQKNALSPALRDRLQFAAPQIAAAAQAIDAIAAQPDPIGELTDMRPMPSGIHVGKMRVPIGVIFMIYESRPNVTADAAALALKAGNAVILRGGSEARHTNAAIAARLRAALAAHTLTGAAQIVTNPDRQLVGDLLAQTADIDLVIPRGGKALVERVTTQSRIPLLKHLDGNCHVYLDAAADPTMATAIAVNSKTRRYGVCNAAESLLFHQAAAATLLPPIAQALAAHRVQIRACPRALPLIRAADPTATPAAEEDWYQEYLAPVLSVKIVDDLTAAIAHINHYGSAHTDAIVTGDITAARRFMREVDSSSVIINAATGFADGGEYGLGAEIGISTDKLHARGPVGVRGLTTQKYVVMGNGECRP